MLALRNVTLSYLVDAQTVSATLQYWLEVPKKCLCAGQKWRVPSFQAWATDRTLS